MLKRFSDTQGWSKLIELYKKLTWGGQKSKGMPIPTKSTTDSGQAEAIVVSTN